MPRPRPKGRQFEREVAAILGGGVKRTPLSGAAGGNDWLIPDDHIWNVWGLEGKRRAKLPALVTNALLQAERALGIGSAKKPAVLMREDNGRAIFCAYLDDVKQWAAALSEIGQAHRVKSLVRQARRILEEVEAGV